MFRFLALSTILCASHATAQLEFELSPEPGNNDLTAPETVVCGNQHYGNLAPGGDVDMWCVTLASDGRLLIWTSARGAVDAQFSGGTSAIDTVIKLIADDGTTVIATNDDEENAPGLFSKLLVDVSAGTYYVKVSGFGADFGNYGLDVVCLPPGGSGGTAPGSHIIDVDNSGCPGTSGVPMTVVPRTGERPRIGSVWTTDFAGVPAGPIVLLLGVIAPTDPPSLVFDLAPLGAPGCPFSSNPFISVQLVPTVPGETEIFLPIGDDPGSLGVQIELQIAAVDVGANALDAITSNRLTTIVGDGN